MCRAEGQLAGRARSHLIPDPLASAWRGDTKKPLF